MDSRRSGLLRAALTLALPIIVLSALFPGAVFRGESFWVSDLGGFHRPIRSLLVRLAHESGGLPLWNPYLALGQPYAANPHHAVFHPTTALFFLLPFETAFRLQVLLPILGAFAAMVFFLRTMGRSLAAALFGGLCWAFGGAFLSGTILLPIALTLAPMPATLAFAIRLVRARDRASRLREAAGCALCFGLQGLSGEPGSLLITMGLGVVALLEVLHAPAVTAAGQKVDAATSSLPEDDRPEPPKSEGLAHREHRPDRLEPRRRLIFGAALLAGAFALGIGVAGAALVPGAALGARSSRALTGGIEESGAAIWSMPPARLAEIAFPRAFGYLDRQWDEDGWYWGASSYPKRGRPFLFALYGGSIALALAAAGIARRPKRLAAWLLAGAVGGILALGPSGLLWTAARGIVPLFANVRYPERWFLATAFVVAIAAAFGFDALREREGRTARRIVVWGLAAFGVAAVAASSLMRTSVGGAWLRRALDVPGTVAANATAALSRDLLIAACVAAAGAAAAALASRRSRLEAGAASIAPAEAPAVIQDNMVGERLAEASRMGLLRTTGVVALIAITALDLVHAFRPFALTDPPELLGVPPPTFQKLIAQRPAGPIFHYAAYDRTKNPVEDRAAPPVPALWGLATTLESDFDISELAWSRRGTIRFFEAAAADPGLVGPLLARRGVGAIVRVRVPSPTTGAAQDASGSGADPGAIDLLRPNGSLPFMVCLESTEAASGETGWLAAVKRLGLEAARTAVVDPGDASSGVPQHPSPCDVTAVTRTPVRIEADVRANGPGFSFLAINQTWDVGWHAHVDDADSPLLRTDLALSALLVPPGSHRIELTYHDPWIRRGAIVSVVSLALCAAMVLIAQGARRISG